MNVVIKFIFPAVWSVFLFIEGLAIFFALYEDRAKGIFWETLYRVFSPITFSVVGFIMLGSLVILTYFLFVVPIAEMRREIALFITGTKTNGWSEQNPLHPDLAFITNFFRRSLEILKTFKSELQSGRALKSEVELAADLQKNILDKPMPSIPSLDIVARAKSASEVGGDSYDIIGRGDNYYIYIGDVTGHGVASGFVMMIVNALISGFSNMLVSGSEIISRTNEIMKPRVKKNMLMTLLMLRWNEAEKKMYMTGAGHEYLIVYKASVWKAIKVKSGGIALGMTRDISKILKEVQLKIELWDILVLYTDGITEARNGRTAADTVMFGVDRLVETINAAPIKSAQGVFNHITLTLSQFMGYNHKQFDDITLMIAHYHGGDRSRVTPASSDIPLNQITEWNWS